MKGLGPRERRLTLITSVVVGCWGLVSFVVQPLWERVNEVRLHVETHTEKLEALGRLLKQAPSVTHAYAAVAPYLNAAPLEEAQSTFLHDLEALSRASSVQLNLKPRQVKRDGTRSHFEVELDVEGPQPQLMGFLDALFRMPNLITIERLRMSSVQAKESLLRVNLVIQQLLLAPERS